MKTRKTLLVVLSLVLVAVVSVTGTLAYLSSTTQSITNTFTVGKVEIDLNEYELDTDKITQKTEKGIHAGGSQEYKVYPGQVLDTKDGIVTIKADSEKCWVFVKVEETDAKNMLTVGINSAWVHASGLPDGVYVYQNAAQNAVTADTDLTRIIDTVTISTELKAAADLQGASIKLTAYAIQADGLDTAAAAWTAGGWGN